MNILSLISKLYLIDCNRRLLFSVLVLFAYLKSGKGLIIMVYREQEIKWGGEIFRTVPHTKQALILFSYYDLIT